VIDYQKLDWSLLRFEFQTDLIAVSLVHSFKGRQ
jgi:hypothetical protein